MTAISALITKNWIAAASDSLLTEFYPNTNTIKHIEFKKSKIVPIRKFKAAAAYWGLAKINNWNIYDFLKSLAAKADRFETFEGFANNLKDELKLKLDSIPFSNSNYKGIGIHLLGYEEINNQSVPELFLICNYTSPTYSEVSELSISRNLYKTLPGELRKTGDTLEGQRIKIVNFLNNGGTLIFNNGDPELFNPAANAIHNMFNVAMSRDVLIDDYKKYMKLTSRPIEVIKNMQKDFFKKDFVRVGGKIHHLLITNQGNFFSDTDDNLF
ncbi:MAG: hypothetical protein PHO95_08445 [Bacteroidales bacterium]|jgi:hypothetical protein|nr:hypothetical protein [Bacteroidales bacterium]